MTRATQKMKSDTKEDKKKEDKKKNDKKKEDKKYSKKVVESSDDDDYDDEYDDDDEDNYETVSESNDQSDDEDDDTDDTHTSKSKSTDDAQIFKKIFSSKTKSNTKSKKGKDKTKSKSKKSKDNATTNKEVNKEVDSEDEDEDDSDYDEDEYDSDYDEEDEDERQQGIILSIDAFGGSLHNDEHDYKEMIKEDKHETCDSDDEKTFMKENYIQVENSYQVETANVKQPKNKKVSTDKKEKVKEVVDKVDDNALSVEEQYKELSQLKKDLVDQLSKNPKNKILQNAIQECRQSIAELVKKERKKNAESYYKLVHKDADEKRNMNEMSYFKKKLSHKEQLKVMEDLKEINSISNTDKPYRLQLLESNIPPKFKAIVLQKLNVLKMMDHSDSEYYKLKNWVDGFMRVPYGIYKNLSVTIHDGCDVCHDFIMNAKSTLDSCVYGLDDAKLQILQMIGQWISNPAAMGTSIAIKGPMGTGKTTLVKEGISKILGREFAFIALGGTGDSSFLEGHSYTYEGSTWGKVISILMESKCMNPVIYFDELDKLSDTPKGEEIAGILTHMTDTTQNSQFHDRYFSEVDFDLSKCLFIFSYNDETKVNPILRDRMYRIQTKGYDNKEKMIIARKHLLPKIREQVNFKEEDVIIHDDVLQYIIGNDFCKDEQGVRNLKRCLEIIHTKLNLFRLVKSDYKLFSKDMNIDVQFPISVTKVHVDALVKKEDPMSQSMLSMYV